MLGEIAVATRFGDAAGAAKAGICDGVIFADVQVESDVGAKFGEAGAAEVEAAKLGDVEMGLEMLVAWVLGIVGRKLGDVANESARFDGVVANKAWKFGDVEPVMDPAVSSAKTLGHTVSAPTST
jgi:hypothetical protein